MDRILRHLLVHAFVVFCTCAIYVSLLSNGYVSAQEVKIGVLLPLNGKLAIVGDMEKKAVELALEQSVGTEEMVSGPNIFLRFADTLGEPETAKQAMERLIADGAVALIGGCSSSATLAAAQVAEDHGIPFLITTASADKITEMDMKYVFRLCLPSSEYLKPIVSLLGHKRRLWRAALLREKSRLGEYETRKILKICRKARVLITDVISYPAEDTSNGATYFQRLREITPQILFVLCNDAEAVRILALCEAMERPPKLLIAIGEPFLDSKTFSEAQVSHLNVFTTALWHQVAPYAGTKEFVARFLEKYGIKPDYHAAQAYAAMQVISDAIKGALSPDPADIREALGQTQMMTVFGPVAFQSYGDKERQNRPPALLLQWQKGRLNPVQY